MGDSVEKFLARGGKIEKCKTPEYQSTHNSRFNMLDKAKNEDLDRGDRLPQSMNKKGVFKHRLWTLKFRGY